MGAEDCNQAEDETGKAVQVMKVKKAMKVEKIKDQKVKEAWSPNQKVLDQRGQDLS